MTRTATAVIAVAANFSLGAPLVGVVGSNIGGATFSGAHLDGAEILAAADDRS